MDLKTVKTNIDKRVYTSQQDCAADIRLIWANAMLYNSPSSKIYMTAKTLSEQFESMYAAIAEDDKERPPTADEMHTFVSTLFKLSPEELGKVISFLDVNCPMVLIKRVDSNEVEINVDLLPGIIFHKVSEIVLQFMPGIDLLIIFFYSFHQYIFQIII